MKICMVVWKYYPCVEGGAERQCRKLVEEFAKRNIFCNVLTARVDKNIPEEECIEGGGHIIRLGGYARLDTLFQKKYFAIKKTFGLHKKNIQFIDFWLSLPFVWLSRLSFILSLKTYLRSNFDSIDILHVHEAHWIAGAVGWASEGLGLPVVCKEASYPSLSQLSYDTPLRKKLAGFRKRVNFVAITEASRKSLIGVGISPPKIKVISNGVQIPTEKAAIIDSKAIVYIGNFTQGCHLKGFDILFSAWTKVQDKRKDLSLIVLGGGDSSNWKDYLQKHNCLDSVIFKGSVPDVGFYLKEARAFLLPSRVEGLSNALLEAMSWGVPVIISDIPAHRNLVKHLENGVVVPVNDSDALSQAILDVVTDDSMSIALGKNGRQTIIDGYSIERVTSLLESLYAELQNKNNDCIEGP